MKREKAVVIVPTYNEKGNIERLIGVLENKIFPQMTTAEMHILVVDDSSPDGTAEIVRKLQETLTNLHLLVNPKKVGLGNAYTKGMDYALDTLQADIVYEFDADLQHDPDIMPEMLQKIQGGYDMVLGSRYIRGGGIPAKWGFMRKFWSVGGNLFIRLVMTNFKIHDWTGGYRAITKAVVQKILPQLNQELFMGYTFQIGFLHKTLRAGYKVGEVPFHFRDRTLGKSKLGPEYIKNILIFIIKVRAREIYQARVFRFLIVGSIGALTQLMTLHFIRIYLPYQLAFFFAIELAVLVNFVISNTWTFADRKLTFKTIPIKFIQFNAASFGSILIQQTLAITGEHFIGLYLLFNLPIINLPIDTGLMYAVVGILIGMIWNFFAYTRFVWSAK